MSEQKKKADLLGFLKEYGESSGIVFEEVSIKDESCFIRLQAFELDDVVVTDLIRMARKHGLDPFINILEVSVHKPWVGESNE